MVTVAQLVESRIVIPVVVGSSPIGHPFLRKGPPCVGFFVLGLRYVLTVAELSSTLPMDNESSLNISLEIASLSAGWPTQVAALGS